MKSYADDLQFLYDSSDKWMCSPQCPCKASSEQAYQSLSESDLNRYGRTAVGAEGYIEMNFPPETQADTDYYPSTFFDCYFEWKADWEQEEKMKAGSTPGAGGTNDWKPDA